MAAWGSYSFLYGPVVALVAIALLALGARRASGGRASLIERPSRAGAPEEYGLMIPVASPSSADEAARVAARLESAGVPGRVVDTVEGRRVMVWAHDVPRARRALDDRHG